MTETTKHPCPPYATFAPFLNFLNKLRDTQVPGRIDPSVFGNASGSLSYSIIAALKALKLIGADGVPAPELVTLVKAGDDDRKALLTKLVLIGYPTLFNGKFDVTNATAAQFDEHIRENYEAKGSTVDKVAAFFIALTSHANVSISDLIKQRKPISSSASANKSKKQRKEGQATEDREEALKPGRTTAPTVITEKALEYRLVDLMSDAIGNPDVMQAIITIVTFLKSRDAEPVKAAASA